MFKKALIASLLTGACFAAPSYAFEPFIGEIKMVGFNFAPRGYAFCDGQLLPIALNSALFSLLGTTYGGDGRTTFALPDMRGRTAIHPGTGTGLSSYRLGQIGGAEMVTLNQAQVASHSHVATTDTSGMQVMLHAHDSSGNSSSPDGKVMAVKNRTNIYSSNAPDVTMSSAAASLSGGATTSIANAGGNQAHENRMPYIAVYHVIALVGIFPSRS